MEQRRRRADVRIREVYKQGEKWVSTERKLSARVSETLKSEGTVPTSLSLLLTPTAISGFSKTAIS